MNSNIFYQVMQNGNGVGFFRELKNAERYANEFNTKTEVSPIKIVKEQFLDDMCDEED